MMNMQAILDNHDKWLRGEEGGERADLWGADLRGADLRGADLREADLREADLREADLREADLRGADLRGADLSNSKGLLSQGYWMNENFTKEESGYVVYKAIGDTPFAIPEYWSIAEGEYLEEVCNSIRVDGCACGVNFGTLELVEKNHGRSDIWECLIEWADCAGIVVPYNTDGKARCERLKLVRKLDGRKDERT